MTECLNVQDWQARCDASCVNTCIDINQDKGPIKGPKYGLPQDLRHNLMVIYDGNGEVYLQNTYGTDISHESFDAVVDQVYAGRSIELEYHDLREPVRRGIPLIYYPDPYVFDVMRSYVWPGVELCQPCSGAGCVEGFPEVETRGREIGALPNRATLVTDAYGKRST